MSMVSQERIVEKVREIMNEAGENAVQPDAGFLSEDTLSLDKYIVSCIPDAVLMVITNSSRCVNPKENSSVSVVQEAGENYGHIVCPDDFVTLVALKMKGWKRIVSKTYGTDSETYRAQCNEATRAGTYKPVGILTVDAQGKKVIEYYSVKAEHQVEMFVYEASYNEEEGLNMNESDSAFAAICYMTASLVYSIFENPDTAKQMQVIAINLLSGNNDTAD